METCTKCDEKNDECESCLNDNKVERKCEKCGELFKIPKTAPGDICLQCGINGIQESDPVDKKLKEMSAKFRRDQGVTEDGMLVMPPRFDKDFE